MTISRDLFRECRRRYAGRFEREPGPCREAVNWLAAYLTKHPGASEDECKTAAEEDRGVSPTVLAIIYMLVVVAIEVYKLLKERQLSEAITKIACEVHGVKVQANEGVCENCQGSGRHRVRFWQTFDERRDTITCPACGGEGKIKC